VPSESRLQFRRAGPADVEIVRAITEAAYAKWVPIIGRKPKPMVADHAAAIRDHEIELALVDGKPAGLIELIPATDHLLLESIAIDPAAQGTGLGRALMRRVEDQARARNLPQIRLYTNKAFAANVDFYLRLGYAIDREEPFMGGLTVYFSKPAAEPA
jgi:GNAT superfamily N-acetyltransferase